MRPSLFLIGLLASVSPAGAQAPASKGPPVPPSEARQFDFWLGVWTVTLPNGTVAGTNRIESIAGGHGLLENWTSARGGQGKSLNTYNAAKREWQQFWVGGDGMVLELRGGLDAQGRMVLTGESHGANAGLNRITWTPHADGTLRQCWELSQDGGRTWSVVFDGRYTRQK